MKDSESLYPVLESAFRGEDSCRTQSSREEVFMASTRTPETSNQRDAPVDPSVASGNAAAGDGRRGGPQFAIEQQKTVVQLLNTPILGESPADHPG